METKNLKVGCWERVKHAHREPTNERITGVNKSEKEEADRAFKALQEAWDNMTDEVLLTLTDEQFEQVKSIYNNGTDECMMIERVRQGK